MSTPLKGQVGSGDLGLGEEFKKFVSPETEAKFIEFQTRVKATLDGFRNPITSAIYLSTLLQLTGEALFLKLIALEELDVFFKLVKEATELSRVTSLEVSANQVASAFGATGQGQQSN